MTACIKPALAACLLLCSSVMAAAQTLQAIEFSGSGDQLQIRLRFNGVPPAPAGYATSNPARLAIDLPGVTNALPQRKYPVASAAADSVTVLQANGKTRMVVNLPEQQPFTTAVEGHSLVVEIGTRRQPANGLQQYGEKLSLNFQDIEVRAVLQLLAEFTGLNLVASDAVTGTVTMQLNNVPWQQALDIILKSKGLDQRLHGNILMVAPAAELKQQEKLALEASIQLEQLTPVQTEHFRIRYADVNTIAAALRDNNSRNQTDIVRHQGQYLHTTHKAQAGVLSPRGSVLVDERTNSLIVTDTAPHLKAVRELLAFLDLPVKQVMIEARIVSANDDFSRELGIRWGGTGSHNKLRVGGSLESVAGAAPGPEPVTASFPQSLLVDLGVSGAPGSLAFSYLGNTFNVAAELSALESNGQGEIISQPKVVTGNKQAATIKAGQEVGFQQATASGATSVAFKEAVLQLDVTPNITPDNRILMDLVVTQDSISGFVNGENNAQIPLIDTTELVTQVLINNGETIVLGGVFEQTELHNEVKTPLLGDIPVVGRLFKRTVKTRNKRETLIFITPRIIGEQQ